MYILKINVKSSNFEEYLQFSIITQVWVCVYMHVCERKKNESQTVKEIICIKTEKMPILENTQHAFYKRQQRL